MARQTISVSHDTASRLREVKADKDSYNQAISQLLDLAAISAEDLGVVRA